MLELQQRQEERLPLQEERLSVKKVLKRVAQLPSGGIFYPKGFEVYFTPMTVKEAEMLNESEVSTLVFFNTMLDAITTVGMDKTDLTYPDFIYIALMRRLYSQEDILGTSIWYCEECGQKNKSDFDFTEISFAEPTEKRNPARCVIGDFAVDISPLTIGGTITLYENAEISNADTLAYCVKAIYKANLLEKDNYEFTPVPYSLDLAKEIINSAYGDEADMLLEIDKMYFHFLEDMEFTCSNKECKHKQKINLGSPEALVFPRSRRTSSVGHKIFFS